MEIMRILLILICINLCCKTEAQTKTTGLNHERAKVLVEGLSNWYNENTGLWETTSWWNGANVLTALIKYGQNTGDESLKKVVENTFRKTKEFEVPAQGEKEAWICKNYINDYYDDEGWWALAWLDAWQWTGDKKYLEMSRVIFSDMTTGWNDDCGGGLLWKKGLSYKGTISNGLTFTLATRLHLAETGHINGRSCLQWSMDIWKWMMNSELVNNKGLMQDGVRNKDGKCELVKSIWTYNQGVVLSGLVNLHKITGEEYYLNSAHNLAKSAIKNMVDEDGVLKEINCEPNKCNGDAEQFKGIFMRHLGVLNTCCPQKEYDLFLRKNTEAIWKQSMQKGESLPGVCWNAYSERVSAATVSSALDAFNALQ